MGRLATRVASLLTYTSAIIVAATATAQVRAPRATRLQDFSKPTLRVEVTDPRYRATSENEVVKVSTSPVTTKPSYPKVVEHVQAAGNGTMVGYTYYDFQTNASMANRLSYAEDGSDKFLQIVWMVSKDSTRDAATLIPGFTSARGTHYNYLDANDPDNLIAGIEEWKKIETERSGWPSIGQFDDGSIAFASHVPIKFFRNSDIGDEQFFQYGTDVTTLADSAVWARIAVDGDNNIHMIYNKAFPNPSSPGNPIDQIAYRRSTDGGDSWSNEIMFTGDNAVLQGSSTRSEPQGLGGDSYAIAARGNVVAVAYTDNSLTGKMRMSTDFGATWNNTSIGLTYIVRGNYTYDSTFVGDSVILQSDTVPTPGSMCDIIIDSKGLPHVAFGQVLTDAYVKDVADPSQRTKGGSLGYIPISQLYTNVGIYYWKGGDSVIYTVGLPENGNWDGQGKPLSYRYLTGLSRYPQMGLDAQDNVYLAYASIVNGDVKSVVADTTPQYSNEAVGSDTLSVFDALNNHIFVTHKYADYPNWSAPYDATPMGSNALFPSVCDVVANGRIYLAYSVSDLPGDRVTNTEMPAVQADVYVHALSTSLLNIINDVNEEDKAASVTIDIAPNPADDYVSVSVSSVTSESIGVSVVSVDGQRFAQSFSPASENRMWKLMIPTRDLASGSYFLVVEQNGHVVSQPLNVIH